MTSDILRNYIQENRNLGVDDFTIRRTLVEAGWNYSEVDEALRPAILNHPTVSVFSKKIVAVVVLAGLIPSAYFIAAKELHLWPFKISSSQLEVYVSPEPSSAQGVIPSTSYSPTPLPSFSNTSQALKSPSSTVMATPRQTSFQTPLPSATPATSTSGNILSSNLCSFDISLMPQARSNAMRLLNLCERDAPLIEAKFGLGPRPYRIQFYVPGTGPEGTGTNSDSDAYVTDKIYLSTSFWQTQNTGDEEILAHEMTHALQLNGGIQYNWVTEALADYGAYMAGYQADLERRCYHFSSDIQNQTHIYDCTYKFIKFSEKYDPQLAVHLQSSLKSHNYSVDTWAKYTGKTFDQLTNECSQDSQCVGLYHGGL